MKYSIFVCEMRFVAKSLCIINFLFTNFLDEKNRRSYRKILKRNIENMRCVKWRYLLFAI